MMKKIALGLLLALGITQANAQAPTQQVPTRLDAASSFATATGAGNTTVTATLTPPGGQYVYVTFIDIEIGANAAVTGAAVVQACVTTGLATNMTFEGDNSTLTTGQVKLQPYPFNVPLKTSSAGTAFSVQCSGLQSTQTMRVNVGGYFAP
jgi:hypothetical protein